MTRLLLTGFLLAGGLAAQPMRRPKAPPPGPELVQRLAAMSAEDRERALSALAPQRRMNLEQRIREFQAMPPAQQRLMRERAEKLAGLPPNRQEEVRASLREFNDLPQERKGAIRREVMRMTGMPNDSREAYMNTDGFRNRFSASERKLIDDLWAIAPNVEGRAEPPRRPEDRAPR